LPGDFPGKESLSLEAFVHYKFLVSETNNTYALLIYMSYIIYGAVLYNFSEPQLFKKQYKSAQIEQSI
jgi:hypothetical protein